MTDLSNDELRALVEAATPGPWHNVDGDIYDNTPADNIGIPLMRTERANYRSWGRALTDEERQANAALIALAPSLAAEVLALREERERLRGALALADKALRPAVVQAAGGPRIAEIGAWLATADDAIGLIEAALAEPQS
jgi:hypothetical protein